MLCAVLGTIMSHKVTLYTVRAPTGKLLSLCVQVRYLKIIEKSGYQALPWVRYITQNGDYQLRTQ